MLPPSLGIPNHPTLPVLLYRSALTEEEQTEIDSEFASRLHENGWSGFWRDRVFSYHHYHPDAHEVLAVVQGSAELQLGGPQGPIVTINAGDVLVLPVGTGHKRIRCTPGFYVLDAYPAGQERFSIYEDNPGLVEEARQRATGVALPAKDPVYGDEGPLIDRWHTTANS